MPRIANMSVAEMREKLARAAQSLFLEKGYAQTEMSDIAQRAGVSRSTVYRHFSDKAPLAFIAAQTLLIEWTEKAMFDTTAIGLSGYEKLERFSGRLIEELCENPAMPRFLAEFDLTFRGEYPDIAEAAQFKSAISTSLSRTAQFTYEGIADRSIRPMKDPMFWVSALMNTILGLGQRMLPRTGHYQEEQNVEAAVIIRSVCTVLLQSMRT